MRVLKSKVSLLAVAVAGIFASGVASAIVTVTAGSTSASTGQIVIASETATSAAVTTTAAFTPLASFSFAHDLGFGLSSGQTNFLRYDLVGGTWGTQIVAGNMSAAVGTGANFAVAIGGAPTDTFVIFQITGAPSVTGNPSTDVITFAPAGLKFTAGNVAPTMKYTLYATNVGSINQDAGQVLRAFSPIAMAKYESGLAFTALTAAAETLDAASQFKKFCVDAVCATTKATNIAAVGGLKLDLSATTTGVLTAASLVPTTFLSLVSGASLNVVSTVAGTSAFAPTSIDLYTSLTCGATSALPAGWATNGITGFKTISAPLTPTTGAYICATYANPASAAIVEQSFNFTLTGSTGAITATQTLSNVGKWSRNGVVLQSPWFSINANVSPSFFLVNNSNTAAPFTVALIGETGNTLTAGTVTAGTVAANSMLRIPATDVLASVTGSPRASAVFTFVAPSNTIQGTFNQLQGGAIAPQPMLRPGSN